MSDYTIRLIDPVNPGWGNLHWKFSVRYNNGTSEIIPIENIAGRDKAEIAVRMIVDDEFHVRPQAPDPQNGPRDGDGDGDGDGGGSGGGGGGGHDVPFPGGHN